MSLRECISICLISSPNREVVALKPGVRARTIGVIIGGVFGIVLGAILGGIFSVVIYLFFRVLLSWFINIVAGVYIGGVLGLTIGAMTGLARGGDPHIAFYTVFYTVLGLLLDC